MFQRQLILRHLKIHHFHSSYHHFPAPLLLSLDRMNAFFFSCYSRPCRCRFHIVNLIVAIINDIFLITNLSTTLISHTLLYYYYVLKLRNSNDDGQGRQSNLGPFTINSSTLLSLYYGNTKYPATIFASSIYLPPKSPFENLFRLHYCHYNIRISFLREPKNPLTHKKSQHPQHGWDSGRIRDFSH